MQGWLKFQGSFVRLNSAVMAAYSPLIFCFAAVSIHNLQTDAATLSRQQELHQDGSHSHAMMRREQNAGTPSKDRIKFRARDRVDEILKNGGKIKNAEKINLCNDQYEEGTKDSNDCAQTWQEAHASRSRHRRASAAHSPHVRRPHERLGWQDSEVERQVAEQFVSAE
mmetsp:Transcript_39227/g.70385  ORF Transcript_39227/g.70385 Transcript_39227/m.70385 type:complete len:168 (-) Transcript_39227:259-762(-)